MAIIGISGKINSGKDTVGRIIQYLIARKNDNRSIKIQTAEFLGLTSQNWMAIYRAQDWEIKKFADKLKDIVCILIGCTREQLEDREFKEKELREEWWYWFMKRDAGYSSVLLDYKSTTKEILTQHEGLTLIKTTPRLLLQLLGTECGRQIIHPNCWVNALMSEYKPIIQSTKEEDKRLLSIWKNMNTRCKNPNYEKYHKYGGKGITICKEWEDFQKFRFWALSNGYTNELTLDRVNVNGNYEPSNCRFVTSSLQAFNKGSYHQGTSNLKGVNKCTGGRWQAQIQSKGIKKNLGYYQTEEEAGEVYQKEYDRINKELEEESFNLQRKHVYPNFIITDTRFENELKAVKDRGGITIRVDRPYSTVVGQGNGNWATFSDTQFHPSETSLDSATFDFIINNDKDIEHLINEVKKVLEKSNII